MRGGKVQGSGGDAVVRLGATVRRGKVGCMMGGTRGRGGDKGGTLRWRVRVGEGAEAERVTRWCDWGAVRRMAEGCEGGKGGEGEGIGGGGVLKAQG